MNGRRNIFTMEYQIIVSMTISDRVTLVVIGSHFLASVYHALAYVYSTQAERRAAPHVAVRCFRAQLRCEM